MKKIFLFLGLCLFLGLQAAKKPNRPMAVPNKPLSMMKNFIRDLSDFFSWEEYGYHALSEKNQLYITAIIHELAMDDYCIEMRGMSNAAQAVVGRINAFVVPSAYFNKKSHAFLFISEEWFDSLSELERQALVRHELMHIKCDHTQRKLKLGMANLALLIVLTYGMGAVENDAIKGLLAVGWCATIIGSIFVHPKFSRMCEKEADIEAAKTMQDKQGFIDLFNYMKDHSEDPESRFAIKRVFAHAVEWLFTPPKKVVELFDSHPSLDERIAYISELK